jgi:hypothetical protein
MVSTKTSGQWDGLKLRLHIASAALTRTPPRQSQLFGSNHRPRIDRKRTNKKFRAVVSRRLGPTLRRRRNSIDSRVISSEVVLDAFLPYHLVQLTAEARLSTGYRACAGLVSPCCSAVSFRDCCSSSAFSLAPRRITMVDSHNHVMKPIAAPSDP